MASTWLEQREIDMLVASGFAEININATNRNKEYWAMRGGKPEDDYLLRTMYGWTEVGKEACHPWRFSTPMSWAQQIHESTNRHCIHCGRSTARQKVGARFDSGSKQKRNRTVCLSCHAAGEQLD